MNELFLRIGNFAIYYEYVHYGGYIIKNIEHEKLEELLPWAYHIMDKVISGDLFASIISEIYKVRLQ